MTAPLIHKALNEAMRDIAAKGIAKTNRAEFGGAKVNFRGVEQAMNEISPILVNRGITVAASYSELQIEERAKFVDGKPVDGKATRFAIVKGTFTFTAVEDGSGIQAEAYGEAMDSGDKALTKAQSIAFRTAIFQLFVVPTMSMDTELDDDESDEAANQELSGFSDAAALGESALRAHYDANIPTEDFWKKHGPVLRKAAQEVDKLAGRS